MIPAWMIVATLVVLLLATDGGGVLADFLATINGRGSRVGRATHPNELGLIVDDPQQLADAAGVDLEVYALGRMLASEEGNSPTLYKVAVGWAAVNRARGRIAHLLLAGLGPTEGLFAAQNARYVVEWSEDTGEPTAYAHAGKYASTKIDPHEDDIKIATGILTRQVQDPTGGATNFFSPRVQNVGYDAGKPGYDKNADAVEAKWVAGGLERVAVAGVDPDELAFFRPKGGAA